MNWCREVAAGVWVGVEGTVVQRAHVPPVLRLPLDRLAADRAMAAIARAAGVDPERCPASHSHSCGVGAAIVASPGARVGVDLVPSERVTERHARSVVDEFEWAALAPYGALRPALAWALKEAAAKAEGDPRTCFPHQLAIRRARGRITVGRVQSGRVYGAGWERFDGLLCVWVLA